MPLSWSPDGRVLTYEDADPATRADIWTLSLEAERQAQAFIQSPYVSPFLYLPAGGLNIYDVTPDGQRFLMVKQSELELPANHWNIVQNWDQELKRLVPTR
jgi:hypothetical protein